MKAQYPQALEPLIRDLFNLKRGTLEWVVSGGRDGGKSFSTVFAALSFASVLASMRISGSIVLGRSFYSSLKDSLRKECNKVFAQNPELLEEFDIGEEFIRHKSGFIDFVFVGLNMNPISLKGLSNVVLAIIDEADGCNASGLEFFVPTIRENGALIIWLFNPTTRNTPFAKMILETYGLEPPQRAGAVSAAEGGLYKQIHINYLDNPFLSTRSAVKIQSQKKLLSAALFRNLYLGEYMDAPAGGIFEKELSEMRESGRYKALEVNPEWPLYATADLGYSDMTCFWVWQYDPQRRVFLVLDCVFGNGQTIGAWLRVMAAKGYGRAKHYLPADSAQVRGYTTAFAATDIYAQHGQPCEILPNELNFTKINSLREMFHRLEFAKEKTDRGIYILSHLRFKRVNEVMTDTIEHNTGGLPTKDIADGLLMLPQCEALVAPHDPIPRNMGFNSVAPLGKYDW